MTPTQPKGEEMKTDCASRPLATSAEPAKSEHVEMTWQQREALENIGDGMIASAFNVLSCAVMQRVGGARLQARIARAIADLDEARAALARLQEEAPATNTGPSTADEVTDGEKS